MNKNDLRIGCDIDDVLASWFPEYCKKFETNKHPFRLQDHIITRYVQRKLRTDKEFWLGLPVLNTLDFEPVLYCTKRVNPKAWSKQWLKNNGFPERPVYQVFNQSKNKADLIKGKVDVFIDDSLRNVLEMNAAGVPTLLYNRTHPDCVSVFSLELDEIFAAYLELKRRWKLK